MPLNDRKTERAPPSRSPTTLEGYYGRIGISAVEASVRYARIHSSKRNSDAVARDRRPQTILTKDRKQ
jgi:hypothetical protein